MRTFLLPLLLCTAALSGCTIAPRHPALQNDALPELLPAHEFFANRDSNGLYTISPDGKKIAWIAVKGLGPALFVKSIGQDDVKAFKAMPIGFKWAQDSRRLFYLKDDGGNENYHVLMVDSERPDAPPVDLTPHPGIRATIHKVVKPDPAHILVLHNQRDKALFDLYKINIDTREQTLVAQNPGDAIGVVTDDNGDVVGLMRQSGKRTWLMAKQPDAESLREIIAWDSEETVQVVDVAPDRHSLYLLSNRNRDRVGLTRLDLKSRRETLFYEDPEVDIERATVSRISHEPLFAYSVPGYPKLHVFDAKIRADLERLLPDPPRGIQIISADDSEQQVTVKLDSDGATQYYLVDRGIADPGKIAIMGASYGGYATLVGLTFTPDVFACGVDIVGPSNLATLLETFPEYWKPFMHKWYRYVGDPGVPEQRKRMLEKSPVTRADAVRSPVLIIHAANDARVKQAQADEMVSALRRAGKPVDYLLFADAGHSGGDWSWGKRLRAFRMTEDFLAKCLGGRSSGFDYYELAAWLF